MGLGDKRHCHCRECARQRPHTQTVNISPPSQISDHNICRDTTILIAPARVNLLLRSLHSLHSGQDDTREHAHRIATGTRSPSGLFSREVSRRPCRRAMRPSLLLLLPGCSMFRNHALACLLANNINNRQNCRSREQSLVPRIAHGLLSQ